MGHKALKKIQKRQKLQERLPKKGNITRWGESYEQALWFVEQRIVVQDYCTNHPKNCVDNEDGTCVDDHLLDLADWDIVVSVEAVLAPFFVANKVLQPTLSPTRGLLMPVISGMVRVLKDPIIRDGRDGAPLPRVPPEVWEPRAALLRGLYKRFDETLEEGLREDLVISTLLDPRFKAFTQWPTLNPDKYDLAWAVKALTNSWKANYAPKPAEQPPPVTSSAPNVATSPTFTMSNVATSPTFTMSGFVYGSVDGTPLSEAVVEAVVDQLEQYLSEPAHPDCDDFNTIGLFRYWHDKRLIWPELVLMWRQFHGCPSNTAGVERMFWKAGKQHDDQRKSTIETTLQRNMKAAQNTKLKV